jgi:hypothetical protein
MVKCSIVRCTNPPIGGFQETLNAGHLQDPSAEIAGSRMFWCGDHESALRPQAFGKRGIYLDASQIPQV